MNEGRAQGESEMCGLDSEVRGALRRLGCLLSWMETWEGMKQVGGDL